MNLRDRLRALFFGECPTPPVDFNITLLSTFMPLFGALMAHRQQEADRDAATAEAERAADAKFADQRIELARIAAETKLEKARSKIATAEALAAFVRQHSPETAAAPK
jgi:hypothetical protein